MKGQWTLGIDNKELEILMDNFKNSEKERHRFYFHQNQNFMMHLKNWNK